MKIGRHLPDLTHHRCAISMLTCGVHVKSSRSFCLVM
jgi:hypothetical protein